ncbi:MAG: ATP-binding protein [Neomegalonema sp.]|nr:ATP-binding protein [Neomegalonema sp.]
MRMHSLLGVEARLKLCLSMVKPFPPLRLKKYLPRGLLWRTVLIVVTPMVLLQLIVAYLFVQRHFDGATRQMTEGVAAELSYLVELIEESKDAEEARLRMDRAGWVLGYNVKLVKQAQLPINPDPRFFDVIGRAIEETLKSNLRGRALYFDIDDDQKVVDIRLQTDFGILTTKVPKRRLIVSNPHLLLAWMSAAALVLIVVALLYLRNQVRPIQMLARAADAFGKGRSLNLRPSGAEEVRLAGAAFLDMRERIERHIEQRTTMLSGVSHDMRTPLTRMKLAIEMMERTPEHQELASDVVELEHILDEFLDFARGDRMESFAPIDVIALAEEVVAECQRGGGAVSLECHAFTGSDPHFNLRRQSIKRSLHNLLSNALSYGKQARVEVSVAPDSVVFAIEDDGPGISTEMREDAFRPFQRLDAARNQDRSGGVGLGLALARDAVRGHGGEILLEESDALGGLRAVITLPR